MIQIVAGIPQAQRPGGHLYFTKNKIHTLGVAAIALASAGTQAAECTALGTLEVLGQPLVSYQTFNTSGAFNGCLSFDLAESGVGPLSEGAFTISAFFANWGTITTSASLTGGPGTTSVVSPGVGVSFDSLPYGDYILSYTGVSSGQSGSGLGIVVLGTPTAPAVPEPETYAMMFAGLGIVSLISRRSGLARA